MGPFFWTEVDHGRDEMPAHQRVGDAVARLNRKFQALFE